MARSTAVLVRYDDAAVLSERSVVAGFLAGYTDSTRVSSTSDLRLFATWCADNRVRLLDVKRPHPDLFARHMVSEGLQCGRRGARGLRLGGYAMWRKRMRVLPAVCHTTRRSHPALGSMLLYALVTSVGTGCAGDDSTDGSPDGNDSSTVDTVQTDVDLRSAVLQLTDFGTGWQTDGVTIFPDDVELDVGEPSSFCPGGPVQPLPGRLASIQFETDPYSELYVSQDILQFDGTDQAVEALKAYESCVGEEWTAEDDADEEIRMESLDLRGYGDQSLGFRAVAADGSGGAFAVVRLGHVLIELVMPYDDASQPFDEQLFDRLLATAVERATPIIGG